jgi:tyrosine-protein phosphatase SIW14
VNRRIRTPLLGLWVILLLVVGTKAEARNRGVPPSQGIGNFGKVNDHLYRGAQPDALGIKNLARLGIKTILNLRMTNDLWKAEAAEAGAYGIAYTNVPMKGIGRPTPEQIAKALAIIENMPGPVFVHCRHGCDRTGTVVACYRIKHDQWSGKSALQEAKHYGISAFTLGMRKFILDFGKASVPSVPGT